MHLRLSPQADYFARSLNFRGIFTSFVAYKRASRS